MLAEADAFRQDLAVRAFCLALVEGFAGFGGAFMAFGDDEQVFGAGDADVVQAAVFFVFVAFVFCFGGAFGFARAEAEAVAVAHGVEADAAVAVAAFVAAAGGEDDDGRLQAFGFVDGEELYGVCAGQRRHGGPVGLGRVGELALPPAAVMGGVLFGRAFGEQLLDVAQVEEVAVVVGVGGGGEGLPDAVFGVVKQRGEGGEQAAALPLGAGAVQGGAQVGEGVFVRLCFVFALFDGGEVVEVGLGFVVVGAGEEAVVVGAVFGVADGGEQVGKGAGDAAGKEVLFVLEFAVDAVPVQFLLQGEEAVVAAHEDLDVARADAAQAAVIVAPRVGRGCGEELCGEGGDFAGFFVLVLAAVHPDEGGGDGVAVVVNDAVFQVGGAGGVVVDVVAEAVVVVMGVVFVVRGDEVGGAAVVGEELVAVGGGDMLFEAVVVGDVAAAKAVDGLFGVADEEEEAARRRGVVAQVGVFEQARLVVVEVLGFVHQHDGVAVGEVAGECGTLRAFQGAVQAGDFVVEGGFATLFAGGG